MVHFTLTTQIYFGKYIFKALMKLKADLHLNELTSALDSSTFFEDPFDQEIMLMSKDQVNTKSVLQVSESIKLVKGSRCVDKLTLIFIGFSFYITVKWVLQQIGKAPTYVTYKVIYHYLLMYSTLHFYLYT